VRRLSTTQAPRNPNAGLEGRGGCAEAFRTTFPKNKLQLEATKQIAYAYRQSGQLSQAAGEYERIASQSDDAGYAARRCSMQETSTRNPIPEIAPWMLQPVR